MKRDMSNFSLANRWAMLALLFCVRTGMGIQYQVVAALSPIFMQDFSLSIADIGLLIGMYHAPGALLAFPGGAIAARLGDKGVVLTGLVLMIAGEITMALAHAWLVEVAGRLLAGAGGIFLNVVMTKMVADWFTGKETSTAMAIFGNSAIVGMGLALVTLPFLASQGGRAAASLLIIAYLATSFIALAFFYRTPARQSAVVSLQASWPGRRAFSAIVAAAVVYGLWNAAIVSVFGFGPLMLMERGWSIAEASSTTSIALWVFALSLPAGGLIADRIGHKSTLLVGGILGFAGALLLSSRIGLVVPTFVVLGVVGGLPCGLIMSLPTQVLKPETRAIGMGAFFTVYYALQIAGPWFAGEISKIVGTARAALDVGAAYLLFACIAWAAFRLVTHDPFVGRMAKVPE